MPSTAEILAEARAHETFGRTDRAEQLYRQILQAEPGEANATLSLANLCVRAGRVDEAAALVEPLARRRPEVAQAHHLWGVVLAKQGKIGEGIAALERAAGLAPHSREIVAALEELQVHDQCVQGHALEQAGRLAEAEKCFRDALTRAPNSIGTHSGLGTALRSQFRYAESVPYFRRVVELALTSAEAHYNLSVPLLKTHQFDEALVCQRRAIEIQPGNSEFHLRHALTLLLLGRMAEGWSEYEWRWREPGRLEAAFDQPRWTGQPLEGRTILLVSEQGRGDTLQFIRYAALAKGLGAHVVVDAHPTLARLMSSAIDCVVLRGDPLPPYDYFAPLLSLPGIFRTTLDTIPTGVPYLSPAENLVNEWGKRLGHEGAFRVGIAWQGNPTFLSDAERSMALANFSGLAATQGVRLYSLQFGQRREQLTDSPFADKITDLADQLGDFHNTAAIVKNLDLVITSDSAPAHLAGAIGGNVWVALAHTPDWRWLLAREDCPWYPTMRLFRQSQAGRWDDVFSRMQTELARLVASRG